MRKRSKLEMLFMIVPMAVFVAILAAMLLLALWTSAGVEEEILRTLRRGSLFFYFFLPAFTVSFGVWIGFFIRKTRKAAEKESVSMEFYNAVEEKRDTVLYLYEFIAVILCLGYFISAFLWRDHERMPMLLIGLAVYILPIFLIEMQMRRLKKIMKKYFPHQKGNVYGSSWNGFNLGEWMSTSDEGEQMIIYKATYRTYRKVKQINFSLLIFFGILTVNWDVSLGLLAVTALFWILLNSIFYYERNRLKTKSWEND